MGPGRILGYMIYTIAVTNVISIVIAIVSEIIRLHQPVDSAFLSPTTLVAGTVALGTWYFATLRLIKALREARRIPAVVCAWWLITALPMLFLSFLIFMFFV